MKRIVSLILTCAMLIGMLPISAWSTESDAVGGTCGENLEWKLNANGTLIISGTGEMVDYSYESPAPWIRSSTNIAVTAIVFEGSVTKIGASAFSGLDEMESITIPEMVTEIGDNAFSGCCKLTEITIPEAVTYIGEYAFFNCTAVEEIYYCAEAAEEIGTRAFALVGTDCKDTVVTIANTVKEIPASLFYADTTEDGCYPHITDVNFEDNSICESIGELAFWQCVDLTEVDIPKSVKTIGWGAFYGCSSLDKVNYAGTEDLWNDIDIGSDNDILTDHEIHYGEATDPSPAPHEHSYSEWYETKAPTQDAEGEERRDCTGCDHYEIRVTDKLPITEESGNTCGENLTWTLVDGVLTISGTGFMDEYSENYPAPWYELRNEITSVVINNGVENISESAFAECSSIVSIDIADSVNSIGPYAFKDCSALTSIDIPDAEQYIGMGTFMGCTSLESVSLPDNLLGIGYEAFRDCESLESISIPASVTEIEDGAFYHCTSLETIALPSTELTLEGGVFNGCSSLKAISIPEGTTTIGNAMFADCVNLESVELPSSITVIHIAAFSGCTSLKSIVLPDKVTTIKNAAFNECSNLNSVTIPASVNSIETAAFGSCDALVDVYYAGTEDQWKAITIDELNDGLANATIHYQSAGGSSPEHHEHSYTSVTTAPTCTEQGYTTYTCSCNDSYVSDYVDAAGHSYSDWYETEAPTNTEKGQKQRDCVKCDSYETQEIYLGGTCGENLTWTLYDGTLTISGEGKMYDYTRYDIPWYDYKNSIASTTIVDGVTGVGNHAFSGCENLTNVTLPDGTTRIGMYAFSDCVSLRNIELPNNLTIIEYGVFAYCTNLENATIPEKVTSIVQDAFLGCSRLTQILLPDKVTTIGDNAFMGCESLNSITIPNSVSSIGEYAFCDCSNLTSISIPEGITNIASHTFYDCFSLKSAIIPNSVTGIGDYAFADCSNLKDITLSNNVSSIGECAFGGCSNLISIEIPEGVARLEKQTFYGCEKLTNIAIPQGLVHIGTQAFENCSALVAVTLPESVTSIDSFAFAECSNLVNITIPGSVISVGEYAFQGCSNAKTLTISNGTKNIGQFAFRRCSNLNSVDLPDGLISIGLGAFGQCNNLRWIKIPNSLLNVGESAFNDTVLTDVYYAGSELEWKAVEIESDNSCLTNATIHYNSTGPNSGYTGEGTVHYFYEWDEAKQTAYFDTDPDTDYWNYGSKVTDETDKSVLENLNDLVGTYVLVETKVNEEDIIGPTILLSIKAIETKVGVVTSADENTIVIDGETYTTPADLIFPDTYEGKRVRYFLYEGNLLEVHTYTDTIKEYILYLNQYDEPAQTVCFGITDQLMVKVTEETDTTFISNLDVLLGKYVLVAIVEDVDGKRIESIQAIDTQVGTVTAIGNDSISINNVEYVDGTTLKDVQVGDFVLYHIYNNKIILIGTLPFVVGDLVGWNKETRELSLEVSILSQKDTYVYYLSELAEENSLALLNSLSSGSTTIVTPLRIEYDRQNITYRVSEYYEDEDNEVPEFNEPEFEYDQAKIDQQRAVLIEFFYEWQEAYKKYVEKVNEVLIVSSDVDENKEKEKAINAEAERMKQNDLGSTSKYLNGLIGKEKYRDVAYKALATHFYETTRNTIPNLSSIKLSNKMASATMVNNVLKNLSGSSKIYVVDGYEVQLQLGDYFGVDFGTLNIDGNLFVVCSTKKKCEEAVLDFLEELQALATNSAYNIADAVYTDILGKPLSSLTNKYLSDTTKKIEKELEVVLSDKFKQVGVGNVIKVLDECYTYYTWVNKAIGIVNASEIQSTVEKIINMKFEDSSIDKLAVKWEMMGINWAANKLKNAFSDYLASGVLEAAQWKTTIKCPVNVQIFNESGEQIGYVGNDDMWYTDAVKINRYGNAKEILVFSEEPPSFKMIATDYGKMSCCFDEYNNSFTPIGRLTFYDIPLEPGQEFSIDLIDCLEDHAKTLAIVCGNEQFYADEFILPKERYAVFVECDAIAENGVIGGAVKGTGKYAGGDLVVLLAEPDDGYEFAGWFNGTTLLDDSIVHEFIAKENIKLIAKFKANDKTYLTVLNGFGGTTIGGGEVNKGDLVNLVAIPYDGYKFAGWYLDDVLVSATEEYSTIVHTDTMIEALFTVDEHKHVSTDKWIFDEVAHWHKCTGCDEKLDLAAHSGGTATCTKKAVCAVCGTSYGELASHDYESSWSQGDANGHWHECKNCSAHDTQVKHTPGAAATEDTAQFCTVCGYVITPALGHTCTAGTQWYSNGTYHWHLCTSCGAWVKTSYHSYSSDTDETCNVCGYTRTVTATEPTQETEVAMTETTEATVSDEEVIAIETAPTIVSTETNESLSDDAVSEDTDSHRVSGVLITVFTVVALGSLAALAILLVYKKRRESK